MHIAQFFFERPYVARGEPAPDKSGIAYAYHVCVGFKYWLRHEMPLLPAWGFVLLSYAILISGSLLSQVAQGTWWYYPLLLVSLPFAFVSPIAFVVVLMVCLGRLGDALGRMWNRATSKISHVWHVCWDPISETLQTWWKPIASWFATRWKNCASRLERVGTWLANEPRGQIVLISFLVVVTAGFVWHDPDFFVSTFNEFRTEHDWFFTIMKYLFGLYVFVMVLNIILVLATPLIRRLRKRPE